MSDLRTRFAARFGEDLTVTVETVAEHHTKVIPGPMDRGSDEFRWALVWALGWECLTRPEFRLEHGVTTPWADLAVWIHDEADLANYDGTMDLAGRGLGLFDFALGQATETDREAGLDAGLDWVLATMPIEATA
jgi:hypothetical protein